MITIRVSLLAVLLILGCANRGNPTGGEIDMEPPVVLKSSPENFSTNFKAEEIEIIFDEYIRLSNIQKELIISPPIEPQPLMMPMGSASKVLTVSEFDSLRENTTYSFHFGESIEDNNEKNALSNYRYVFSTGDYIDSLSVKGTVTDAFNREISENINVLLYQVDSLFTDSIIYREKPKHVGKVIDSTNQFLIQNIKEGKYLIIALEEENKDYTFQSKVDKIGFIKDDYVARAKSLKSETGLDRNFVIENVWFTKNPYEVEQKIFSSLQMKKNEEGEYYGKSYRSIKELNGKAFIEFVDGAILNFFCERIEEFIQE